MPPVVQDDAVRYLQRQKLLYGDQVWLPRSDLSAGDHSPAPDMTGGGLPLADGPLTDGPLAKFQAEIHECQKCPLGATRNKFVFGTGNPQADLVFLGEAPGAEEDRLGEPFVGRAGKLLDKMLAAIGLSRSDVYILNVLKCRPPENRNPKPDEVAQCEPYLQEQLRLLDPKLIVTLGRVAAQTLLRVTDSLKDMRARVFEYRGIEVRTTYHPAALLRNPNWKAPAWVDFQAIRDRYLELTGQPPVA